MNALLLKDGTALYGLDGEISKLISMLKGQVLAVSFGGKEIFFDKKDVNEFNKNYLAEFKKGLNLDMTISEQIRAEIPAIVETVEFLAGIAKDYRSDVEGKTNANIIYKRLDEVDQALQAVKNAIGRLNRAAKAGENFLTW